MWGVPKLEPSLMMWLHPKVQTHILEVTQIAEAAYSGRTKDEILHKKEITAIKEKHRFDLESMTLKHSQEVATLNQRIHDLESRFIKDSHNSHNRRQPMDSKSPSGLKA